MIGKRIGYGALAVGVVVAVVACAAPAEHKTATPRASTPSARETPRPEEVVHPLHQQALPNADGKTFTSAIVDFPPSARAVPHRHGNAFIYAYVLSGRITSRQGGEKTSHTYRRGEYWVEPPGVHHVQTDNASRTEPAKLLVVFISDTGDPLKIPDPSPPRR